MYDDCRFLYFSWLSQFTDTQTLSNLRQDQWLYAYACQNAEQLTFLKKKKKTKLKKYFLYFLCYNKSV